jgi:hypothetical protein
MTKKQITRKFLHRAQELSTRELVFFDEYINSVASKDSFPPVQQLANCLTALHGALPSRTVQALEKSHPTHLTILSNTLDMLLRPGQWLITRKDTGEGTCAKAELVKPRRKLRRKK